MNTVWFYTVLYFGKRGRQNQREMKASDLQLKTTTGGLKYFVRKEKATKNRPGGISDNEDETQSVMMVWPGHPRCPAACLEKYLAKREPRCDAVWQKPKNHNAASFCQDDDRLSGFAAFRWASTSSTIYSRKCARKLVWQLFIQLTAPSYLGDSPESYRLGKQSNEDVTGHSSDRSIESYNARLAIEQQFESSAIVSRFITKQNQCNSVLPAVPTPSAPFPVSIQQQNQLHSRSTFNVNSHPSAVDFSYSTFHGCNFIFNRPKDI